jgi:molybdopterin/thiamine biosynthesis adenylyltransferase
MTVPEENSPPQNDSSAADALPPALQRYARQVRFAELGVAGQQRLMESRAVIIGCGALGTVLANSLARAGVGFLRIVDRDFVELNNLQRQVLFDEADVADTLPKAVAAVNKLRRVNSQIELEPVVADADAGNIEALCRDVHIVLDGTDNFETRFLINDAAVRYRLPWVYGGCLGSEGQVLTIVPGRTACLRCLVPEPPPHGETPTCDTAGILGPVVSVVASLQAMEAIKILSGHVEAIETRWTIFNLWDNTFRQVEVQQLLHEQDCPTCKRGEFPWLSGQRGSRTAVLCGRNAVQIAPPALGHRLSLEALEHKLAGVATVRRNAFLLRATIDGFVLTVFPDGRAIIGGTEDIATARTIYARYIGS